MGGVDAAARSRKAAVLLRRDRKPRPMRAARGCRTCQHYPLRLSPMPVDLRARPGRQGEEDVPAGDRVWMRPTRSAFAAAATAPEPAVSATATAAFAAASAAASSPSQAVNRFRGRGGGGGQQPLEPCRTCGGYAAAACPRRGCEAGHTLVSGGATGGLHAVGADCAHNGAATVAHLCSALWWPPLWRLLHGVGDGVQQRRLF